MFRKIAPWIGFAAIIVIIFSAIYAVARQSERNDANSPQIQIAEDIAVALDRGEKPSSLVSGRVDVSSSMATFTIIYDASGNVVVGSGYLDNQVPVAPIGVLNSAGGKNYNAVTWQPESNIRIAAVTVAADRYYVLSGRSLKEVEKNANETLQIAFAGGVMSMSVLAVAYLIVTTYRGDSN